MTHADRLLEFLQLDMNEFLNELLTMAEKGEQNAPAVVDQLRAYLKEDPQWAAWMKRAFANAADVPARVQTFLDSLN
jgi:hypothetical protein